MITKEMKSNIVLQNIKYGGDSYEDVVGYDDDMKMMMIMMTTTTATTTLLVMMMMMMMTPSEQ